MTSPSRLAAHADASTALALLSDREIEDLVASGTPAGTGIGGRSVVVEVAGRQVFVKQVPLTEEELLAENVRSTANLFDVPAYGHYGIGSPGFGTWRELAVHTMTTGWVVSGRFPGFPLTHHWRVLPHPPRPLPEALADVDRVVAYWGPGLRRRVEALEKAPASLTLFLEHLPHTLHDWFDVQLRTGGADSACVMVERGLRAVTDFLHSQQLVHFDAHFQNILTDGRRLYLADYGLSLSARFRLAPQEREFLHRHRSYDRVYCSWFLVTWLVTALYGHRGPERQEFVRACAEGGARLDGIPPAAAGIITRHAPLAVRMTDFARRLQEDSRLTPYPHEELRRAYSSSRLSA
ncbi:protein kinase family protein [Streptomyces sp. 7R007]